MIKIIQFIEEKSLYVVATGFPRTLSPIDELGMLNELERIKIALCLSNGVVSIVQYTKTFFAMWKRPHAIYLLSSTSALAPTLKALETNKKNMSIQSYIAYW
jgi:hypothetical protein